MYDFIHVATVPLCLILLALNKATDRPGGGPTNTHKHELRNDYHDYEQLTEFWNLKKPERTDNEFDRKFDASRKRCAADQSARAKRCMRDEGIVSDTERSAWGKSALQHGTSPYRHVLFSSHLIRTDLICFSLSFYKFSSSAAQYCIMYGLIDYKESVFF